MTTTRPPVTMDELWRIAEDALRGEAFLRRKCGRLMQRLQQLLPIKEAVLEWLAAQDDPDDYGYRIDYAHDQLKARARTLDEQRRQKEQAP